MCSPHAKCFIYDASFNPFVRFKKDRKKPIIGANDRPLLSPWKHPLGLTWQSVRVTILMNADYNGVFSFTLIALW